MDVGSPDDPESARDDHERVSDGHLRKICAGHDAALVPGPRVHGHGLDGARLAAQSRIRAGGRGDEDAAPRGQGEAGDPSLHGRRRLAPGDLRLPSEARRDERTVDAGVLHQGPAHRAAAGGEAHVLRAAGAVPSLREGRRGDVRALPEARRRLR